MKNFICAAAVAAFLAVAGGTPSVLAQSLSHSVATIYQTVDDSKRITLAGNTRPEATAANDLGAVDDSFALVGMQLQLKRSAKSEAELQAYIDDLSNPKSANYHNWLTPAQFAEQYGVAQRDVKTVTDWLESHGLTVDGVAPTGLTIEFSGTAKQVRETFRTEVHSLTVNGAKHFANMTDPQIPAALEGVVAGVVSIHDFHPKPHNVQKPKYTYTTANGTFHALAAGDIASIYNLAPVFAAGFTGKGQSIMLVEDTYLYSTGDWTVFRKTFGLTRPYPYGTLAQVSPTGAVGCTNPGYAANGDDGEAAIDVEWATAAAPNAAIILAACADTSTFGGLIALENTLNGPAGNLPSVVSISYGEAEAANGATANLAYYTTYQQAVVEGVSIFVSSGDEDAASDDGGNVASHGIGVSGFASTPYNVAVGGTDFGYTANFISPTTYWSATNSNTYSSALSYIPEIPWNNSCAGSLITNYINVVNSISLTPVQLCNNTAVTSTAGPFHFLQNAVGGSGGPSGCATGVASTRGVVSGTCAGYAKPAFQAGIVGNPADGVRDMPDVALFASNGFWDAYYTVCWSNPSSTDTGNTGGFSCNGAPSTWAGFGGTSVSAPIMAGIQALVNQKTGSRWGNPNTTYYALANTEYGVNGNAGCNSSASNGPASSCIFYDITQGDNDAVCKASGATLRNCYRPTGSTYGVLSTSNTVDQPAYVTNTGWDFPTGIGSVNAYNLVFGWPTQVPSKQP